MAEVVVRRIQVVAVTAWLALAGWGCPVEDPALAQPNSEEGHLFVDLEDPLAVDWETEILVFGPSQGGEHCDGERGCYPDHMTLKEVEVSSSDPEIVEITSVEVEPYGEVQALRISVAARGTGEAYLEFEFSVEGEYPPPEEDEGDQEEDQQALQEESSPEGERLSDRFVLEAREVASVRLVRRVDGVDPAGPFGECPRSEQGVYVMANLEQYSVTVDLEKIDDGGTPLRGSGEIPFEIIPEGAVELEEVDDRGEQIRLIPREFGAVELQPTRAGVPFEVYFARLGDIDEVDVQLYGLTDQGFRAQPSSVMYVDYLYELDVQPRLPVEAPLCGGALEVNVISQTPAICDVVGEMLNNGNPAVAAAHGGHCRFQATLAGAGGGHGLEESFTFPVEYAW